MTVVLSQASPWPRLRRRKRSDAIVGRARAWTLPIADLIAGSAWIVLISAIFVWWPMLAHLGLDLLNASLLLGLLTLPAELLAARDTRATLAKSEATRSDVEELLDAISLAAALRPIAAPLSLPLWPFGLLRTAWLRGSLRRRKS